MQVLNVRNVNEAMYGGLRLLQRQGMEQWVRGRQTLELPGPLATVYQEPMQRVLFSTVRDANPFFHLMESLWMLAGRNDVAWLQQYLPRIADYSDNGTTFHGAYGWRLRRTNGDQLYHVVQLLRREPGTRRAVLQIWDTHLDLGEASRDIPCNDLVFLKLRQGALHATVLCRSNDALWGAYGANAVQFSMLLELLAAQVGVQVGTLRQVSDSFHVYTDSPQYRAVVRDMVVEDWYDDTVGNHTVTPLPIAQRPDHWLDDVAAFCDQDDPADCSYVNPWFHQVAVPMTRAHSAYRGDDLALALETSETIAASDWRRACMTWVQRRMQRRRQEEAIDA